MKNKKVKLEIFQKRFFYMRNRKGWMRIVEVFVALLLITSVALIIVNREYKEKVDLSSEIYKIENSILRKIQLDDFMRDQILYLNPIDIPMEMENFPTELKTGIEESIPAYLECDGKICDFENVCNVETPENKDVYVQSATLLANQEKYKPTVLKLFCWMK